MKKIYMLFLIGLCLLFSSCVSSKDIDMFIGLEEEKLSLNLLEEDPFEYRSLISDYSYQVDLSKGELGYKYVLYFRKGEEIIEEKVFDDYSYFSMYTSYQTNDSAYVTVEYSITKDNTYTSYMLLLEIDSNLEVKEIKKSQNEGFRTFFTKNLYVFVFSKKDEYTLEYYNYENNKIKEELIQMEKSSSIEFFDIQNDIKYIIFSTQDEFLLYKGKNILKQVDQIQKDENFSVSLKNINIQNQEFHFYICNASRYNDLESTELYLYEYQNGQQSEIYHYLLEKPTYSYNFVNVIFSDQNYYMCYTVKQGWLAPTRLIILHYNEETNKTTYLYLASITNVFSQENRLYITKGSKIYEFCLKNYLQNRKNDYNIGQ